MTRFEAIAHDGTKIEIGFTEYNQDKHITEFTWLIPPRSVKGNLKVISSDGREFTPIKFLADVVSGISVVNQNFLCFEGSAV